MGQGSTRLRGCVPPKPVESTAMAKYLVTGGVGFIGSNLAKTLVSKGQVVVILDNISNGKRENIAGFADRLTAIKGSITHLDTCRKAVARVDYVPPQMDHPFALRSVAVPYTTNVVDISDTLNMSDAACVVGI